MPNDLPPDGARVVAMTYESLSDDLPPRRVKGELRSVSSPFGGRQCWIGQVQVDPETVLPLRGPMRHSRTAPALLYEATHAPKGGVSIGGKFYTGGEFIPANVMASASAQEKAAVNGAAPRRPESPAGAMLQRAGNDPDKLRNVLTGLKSADASQRQGKSWNEMSSHERNVLRERGAAIEAITNKLKTIEGSPQQGATNEPGQQRTSGKRPGGAAVPGQPDAAGTGVAGAPQRPGNRGDGPAGQDIRVPTRPQTDGDEGPKAAGAAELKKVSQRLARYRDHFAKKGYAEQAEWLDMLQEHLDDVGVEKTLEMLGEENVGAGAGQVQYKGTGYFEEGAETNFIKGYLARAGILLQTGDTYDPNLPLLASAPVPSAKTAATRGKVVAKDTPLEDKLQESKLLPGLESTEDIDKICGKEVTQITADVTAKLDAKYGKDKWIIKTYGDEAYASFGIFLPPYTRQIQQNAQDTIKSVGESIKKVGYDFARDKNTNEIVGLTNTKTGKVYRFGTGYFETIGKDANPKVADRLNQALLKQGRMIAVAAPQEHGARLPSTPEDNIRQKLGILLRRDNAGNIVGITTRQGTNMDFGSPEYNALDEEYEGALKHEVDRAVDSASAPAGARKFMVQPAFEAVGVTEADRALGYTWETSHEGRVHVVVRNGKASVVPFATLAHRSDSLPAVFANDDIRAMEKAAQDTIDALPPELRTGQTYAPDVMKTTEGWKVVELNAAVEGGQSAWMEKNPFVIDAYVSHMTGREPAHAKFIRSLLSDKFSPGSRTGGKPRKAEALKHGRRFDPQEHPRRGKGEAGGEFTKKGEPRTVRLGSLNVTYSLHANKRIKGSSLPLKNYKQQDVHSCGFVAALTVVRYFQPEAKAVDVLRAVRPLINSGVDRYKLRQALKKLGIKAEYRKDLTVGKLKKYVDSGVPVIISVWPDQWFSDHWTVVQGFTEDRVYLTNHKSLSIESLKKEWSDMDMRSQGGSGEGLVCFPKSEAGAPGKPVQHSRSADPVQYAADTVSAKTDDELYREARARFEEILGGQP